MYIYIDLLVYMNSPPQLESIDSESSESPIIKKKKVKTDKCKYCSKLFSSKQARDYHEAIGKCFGILYTCKRCLKPFYLPWKLERHQRQNKRCIVQDKVVVTRDGNRYITQLYSVHSKNESK